MNYLLSQETCSSSLVLTKVEPDIYLLDGVSRSLYYQLAESKIINWLRVTVGVMGFRGVSIYG